jgi:hypothetical protein
MKVKSTKDAAKKKATKTGNVAAKKRAIKPEKAEDICELAVKTEENTKKMMLRDILDIAAKVGIAAGDLNRIELVRAIQRAEGYSDCFMSGQVRTCGQMNCLWYQECVLC